MNSLYLNTKQAAKLLNVSVATIYRWTSERRIKTRKHGGRNIYYKPDLEAWSKNSEKPPFNY